MERLAGRAFEVVTGGFQLIDPDGLRAEPAYDLGVLMREDPVELRTDDPFASARWLGERCRIDPIAIWESGTVKRVSTGLVCTSIDLQPIGKNMLDTAEHIDRVGPGG